MSIEKPIKLHALNSLLCFWQTWWTSRHPWNMPGSSNSQKILMLSAWIWHGFQLNPCLNGLVNCHILCYLCFTKHLSFLNHIPSLFHRCPQTLIESMMLSMKISRLISVTANAIRSTASSTSTTVSLSVRVLSLSKYDLQTDTHTQTRPELQKLPDTDD